MEDTKYSRRKLDFAKRTLSTVSASSFSGAASKVDARSSVVIEIGKRLTRAGFAGEYEPREIFPTKFTHPIIYQTCDLFNSAYTDLEQYVVLVNFFKEIIFRKLLTTINERRLVIVESVFTPTRIRNAIAKAFFECPSLAPRTILFTPGHLVCSFPFNAKNCLVVDVGSQESLTFPVAEGYLMLSQHESTPLSASAVEAYLRTLLLSHGRIRSALTQKCASLGESPIRSLQVEDINFLDDHGLIEDMIVRFCFVTTAERGRKIQLHLSDKTHEIESPPPDVELPFGTDTLILPGLVREATAEVLFTPGTAENRSIPQLILDTLLRIPIDLRQVFFSRLLVMGGLTRMPGFLSRLKVELTSLVAAADDYTRIACLKDVKFFRLDSDVNLELYCAWLGGSMLGNCEIFDEKAITRDDWLAQSAASRTVPDWTNKIDNYFKTPEDNRSR